MSIVLLLVLTRNWKEIFMYLFWYLFVANLWVVSCKVQFVCAYCSEFIVRPVRKITKSNYQFFVSVRLHDSHRTDFHETWNLSILRTSVENIQVSLNSINNNRHFTWRPEYICDNISLNYSENEKYFRESCRENQNTHFVFGNFFPPKIEPLMR